MAQHFVSEGRCQFCHRTAGSVEHMIAGDSGFICNACVFLNVEVAAPPGDFGAELVSRVFDALARHLSRSSCYRGRVLSLESRPQWTGHASTASEAACRARLRRGCGGSAIA